MGADKWLGMQSWGPEGESDRERAGGRLGGRERRRLRRREDGEREGRGVGDSKKQQEPRFSTPAPVALGAVLSIPGQ